MPQYFLQQAGLQSSMSFKGEVGFSDKTIKLVEAGTEVGCCK